MSKPLEFSTPLRNFCEAFEAISEHSHKKFQRRTRLDWIDYNNPNVNYTIETVEAVAIHIPIYKLDEFLSAIPEQHYKEMEIRTQVPAVKKAYEQYRLLLKMCGGNYDAGY